MSEGVLDWTRPGRWPWVQAVWFHEAVQHWVLSLLVQVGPIPVLVLRLRWSQSSQSSWHIVILVLLTDVHSYDPLRTRVCSQFEEMP